MCSQTPVLLLTMVNVALQAYVQPYRQLYVNILETITLVDIILLITSVLIIDYKVVSTACKQLMLSVINFRLRYLMVIKHYLLLSVA